MKHLSTLIALLFLGYAAFTMPIEGIVKAGKEKLAGVLVTDGYQFVKTDAKGKFKMDTDEKANFIYLITPDGYVAPYESGTPEFWLPLTQKQEKYQFNLIPTGKSEKCVLIAIADVQTRDDKQFDRYREQSIPDLKATIAGYPQNTRVMGISLGDIVWDHFEHFPVYKKEMATLGIPFYPVIGNHDHDQEIMSDKGSAETYEKYFGPGDYAFQYGDSYVIVLDNILYSGIKKYKEALTDEQIEWVKALLQFIPKGSQIVVATHSPFHFKNKGSIQGTDKLLAALKDYKTDLISGHTHLNSNHEIAPGVTEHNIGAICGTWWTADVNRDGTPNGYCVLEMSNGQLQWYYKSTGHDRNWQFKVYPENTVKERHDAIMAKVWNWDPQWSVKWYEDGLLKGEMERSDCYDPDYLNYVEQSGLKKYTQPVESFFYFFAKPSGNARNIEVEVTDRFGNTYPRQSIIR